MDRPFIEKEHIRKEDLAKVLKAASENRHGTRDRMLIFAGAALGLRVTEAVYMRAHNFRDLDKFVVHIPTAKKRRRVRVSPSEAARRKKAGHKNPGYKTERYPPEERPEMRITVSREVAKEFKKYLGQFSNPEGWVFPSQKGSHHLNERQAAEIFSKACDDAGIGHKAFHALRRYRGIHVLNESKDLDWTRRQLRHESIETTKIYMQRTPDEEKKLAEKVSW